MGTVWVPCEGGSVMGGGSGNTWDALGALCEGHVELAQMGCQVRGLLVTHRWRLDAKVGS